MELEGKSNGINCTTMVVTKTVQVKPHTNPFPGQEAKLESVPIIAPFPIKKENQKPRTRVEQASKYRECQKNHAASTGRHVVDGCCEFMAGGEEGTLGALKCAACSCHRSFHRKEVYGQWNSEQQELLTPAFYCSSSSYKAMQPSGIHPMAEIRRRTSSSSQDIKKHLNHRNIDGKHLMMMRKKKKKRVRTKINEEQKEKMKEFAEGLGWRMQKKDEEEIDKFCRTVNLRRQVFKVWMHNNKQAMKRIRNSTSNDLEN